MAYLFPSFTSSDKSLDMTYAYRCEVYQKHIKKTPAGSVITEFLPDVPWAGKYNTISCAASHHFREGRWLNDPTPLAEYARFWCTEGNPRLYSFPLAESILALERVTGNCSLGDELYPALCGVYREWDDHKTPIGLYTQLCDRDGMEFAISGDGLRPTINAYMAADAYALAYLSTRSGNTEAAATYTAEANSLRDLLNRRLWNARLGMFGTLTESGEPRDVRELIGYIPWIYGLADEGRGSCFRYLLDPRCFLAPYGLRTADAGHPDYMKPYGHECLWNGPVWPFATSQTLAAMIEYLHTEPEPCVSAEDFMKLLLQFAYSHRDTDGTPWLDENMHPDTGIWLAREILHGRKDYELKDRGRHYNHSSFIDQIMTGVCGICPTHGNELTIRPLGVSLHHFAATGIVYHGHFLDLHWDKTEGMTVTVDGEKRAFAPPADRINLTVSL